MHPMNQLEHMLDGMGLDYEGDLQQAPELERHEGEFCCRDAAGTVYRMDGLNLSVEEPEQLPRSDEKPVDTLKRLERELRPCAKLRAENTAPPPYAENQLEKNGLYVYEERARKLCKAFRDDGWPEWRRRLLFRRLKTEEENAFCAICCTGPRVKEYGLPALEKVTDRSLLFTAAVAALGGEVRGLAVNRFAEDPAALRAVIGWSGKTPSGFTLTQSIASRLLQAAEERQLNTVQDEQQVTQMLLTGRVTQAVNRALDLIVLEEDMLRLMLEMDRPVLDKVVAEAAKLPVREKHFRDCVAELILHGRLRGLEEKALDILEREELFRVIRDGKTQRLREQADCRMYRRIAEQAEKDGAVARLSAEETAVLMEFYANLLLLDNIRCVRLLDPDSQNALFMRRLESGQSAGPLLEYLQDDRFTEQDVLRMFHARDPKTREYAACLIRKMDAGRLRAIVREQQDLELQAVAFSALKDRGEDVSELFHAFDASVLPLIDAARTPDGYDGKKICGVWEALPPVVAEQYGFSVDHDEGETQDGETWDSKKLNFDGHRWWIYYSQTDGGGSWHDLGDPIC